MDQSPPTLEVEWLYVNVDSYKIVNVYKSKPTQLQSLDLPMFSYLRLYAGNFNYRHVDLSYDETNRRESECLA